MADLTGRERQVILDALMADLVSGGPRAIRANKQLKKLLGLKETDADVRLFGAKTTIKDMGCT